jgi:hypothetical protein
MAGCAVADHDADVAAQLKSSFALEMKGMSESRSTPASVS